MRGQHSIFYLVTKTDKFFPEKNPPLLACSGNVSASDFFSHLPVLQEAKCVVAAAFSLSPSDDGLRLLRRGQIHEARVHISLSVCQAGERGP